MCQKDPENVEEDENKHPRKRHRSSDTLPKAIKEAFPNIDNRKEDKDPLANSGEFVSLYSLAEMIANLTNIVATIQRSNQDINANIETMSLMCRGLKEGIDNNKKEIQKVITEVSTLRNNRDIDYY